jgi:hypothetical protein
MIMKNKKAVAPVMIVLVGFGILALFYVILFIPIPAFTQLRKTINYFLIIVLWFLVQGLFLGIYFEIGKYATKGFYFYREYLLKLSIKINNFIETHT